MKRQCKILIGILLFASTSLRGQEFVAWERMTQPEREKVSVVAKEYLTYARKMATRVDILPAGSHSLDDNSKNLGYYKLKNGLILQAWGRHDGEWLVDTNRTRPLIEVSGGAYRKSADCDSGSFDEDDEVVHFFYTTCGFFSNLELDYCLVSFECNDTDRYSGFLEMKAGKIYNAKIRRSYLNDL